MKLTDIPEDKSIADVCPIKVPNLTDDEKDILRRIIYHPDNALLTLMAPKELIFSVGFVMGMQWQANHGQKYDTNDILQ